MHKYPLGTQIRGDITPAIATEYLSDRNTLNREISNSKVNKYVKEMKEGTFDTIKLFEGKLFYIDVDGILVSAQHRMKAAVKADYTFKDALIVVVDRKLFNEKSVEARSPKDIAQMTIKTVDPEITVKISNALHTMGGQQVFLEAKKSYVCKRTEKYEPDDLLELHKNYKEMLTAVMVGAPKVSQGALNALGCLMLASRVDVGRAITLALDPALKPATGSAIMHWAHSFVNEINNTTEKFNEDKVYLR